MKCLATGRSASTVDPPPPPFDQLCKPLNDIGFAYMPLSSCRVLFRTKGVAIVPWHDKLHCLFEIMHDKVREYRELTYRQSST